MESCRKLEKEREKVYYCSSESAEQQVLLNTLCMEPMSEEMARVMLAAFALTAPTPAVFG